MLSPARKRRETAHVSSHKPISSLSEWSVREEQKQSYSHSWDLTVYHSPSPSRWELNRYSHASLFSLYLYFSANTSLKMARSSRISDIKDPASLLQKYFPTLFFSLSLMLSGKGRIWQAEDSDGDLRDRPYVTHRRTRITPATTNRKEQGKFFPSVEGLHLSTKQERFLNLILTFQVTRHLFISPDFVLIVCKSVLGKYLCTMSWDHGHGNTEILPGRKLWWCGNKIKSKLPLSYH